MTWPNTQGTDEDGKKPNTEQIPRRARCSQCAGAEGESLRKVGEWDEGGYVWIERGRRGLRGPGLPTLPGVGEPWEPVHTAD